MRRPFVIIASALVILAIGAGGLLASQNRKRYIEHRPADGVITYNCSSQSKSVDYNPRSAGPTELNIIARLSEGRAVDWSIQKPNQTPVLATKFDAHTDSIGGSQGLLWRDENGEARIAVMSLSDVVGEYGPETIWATLFKKV